MEADLDASARRRASQRAQNERERLARAQREAFGRSIARAAQEDLERARVESAARARAAREREEAELEETGGIRYKQDLKPLPIESTETLETDRLVLPPSALETITSQIADFQRISPLTFELALTLPDGRRGTTCAGVSEFTAEEGTVKVPIKCAESLAFQLGQPLEQAFASAATLSVRYVRLDKHEKTFARIQPLGEGFHVSGSEIANIDLKSTLQRALRSQITLSERDVVLLRDAGVTYKLCVRALSPSPRVLLLNTDLEIDLMPSQAAEKEMEAKRAEEERVALAERLAEERRRLGAARLAELERRETSSEETVTIRARVPLAQGGSTTSQMKFSSSDALELVFEWVRAVRDAQGAEPARALRLLPAGAREVWSSEDAVARATTVRAIAGGARTLNLNVSATLEQQMEEEKPTLAEKVEAETSAPAETREEEEEASVWTGALASGSALLDRALTSSRESTETTTEEEENTTSSDLHLSAKDMLTFLIHETHAQPAAAATATSKYLSALTRLRSLGLLTQESGRAATNLVLEYKGSSARVADALLGLASSTDRCASCALKGRALARCGRCRRVAYCSRECQALDWGAGHKRVCGDLAPSQTRDWSKELEELRSMGLMDDGGVDRADAVRVLERFGGNLPRAVDEILVLSQAKGASSPGP